MDTSLEMMATSVSTRIEKRLFSEYGAIFITKAIPPPRIIFADSIEVDEFQASLSVSRAYFGEHEIELQSRALNALLEAATEIARGGGSITARAADSGSRSYEDTVRLWTRNVTRGLEHWQSNGRLSAERAESVLSMSAQDQVTAILDLEDNERIFFGTFFDRSILYSVAAPGASQHLSKLAFDATEFERVDVKDTLARHGWYRTVPSDLPHFTYLGHDESTLRSLGLVCIQRTHGAFVYDFWVPDLTKLQIS